MVLFLFFLGEGVWRICCYCWCEVVWFGFFCWEVCLGVVVGFCLLVVLVLVLVLVVVVVFVFGLFWFVLLLFLVLELWWVLCFFVLMVVGLVCFWMLRCCIFVVVLRWVLLWFCFILRSCSDLSGRFFRLSWRCVRLCGVGVLIR